MAKALKPMAKALGRRDLGHILEEIGKGLAASITSMLRDEHVRIVTDGWTSCANDSYLSLTVAFITTRWKLVTIPPNCTKPQRPTKGEDLTKATEGIVTCHNATGCVVACNTDWEPLKVKADRILQEWTFCTHIGCCDHRLKSTTSIVFDVPKVEMTMTLAHELLTRYSKSNQALAQLCSMIQLDELRVIQDIKAR